MSSIKLLLITILTKYCSCSVRSADRQITTLSSQLPTPTYPWFVPKNGSYVCILAQFWAQLNINDPEDSDVQIAIPINATVTGNCGDQEQIIELQFDQNILSLTFSKDENWIFVNNITFWFPSSNQKAEYNQIIFKTPKKFYYKCFKEQTIKLSESVNMTVRDVKLEAFKNGIYNTTSGELEQWEREGLKCQLDRIKSDAWKITGISLGVGTLLLSIITLVAIWSGRRQENLMLRIKMQRQWTVDENRINTNSRSTSSQCIVGNQSSNNLKYQRY